MSNLTDSLLAEYKPKLALMIYEAKPEYGRRKYYLESHDINAEGQILSGKPLLQETIQGMVDVFFDEGKNKAKVKGLIPENMLSFSFLPGGNYKMIWYRYAEVRVMHHARQLKLKTDKAWVPGMLYLADHNSLKVYCFKGEERPNQNTPLFDAPFFNVDDDGDVCLGSSEVKKPKEPTYEDLIKYWEDLFWLSEFSHVNGEEKVKSGDLAKVWSNILGTNKKFPINELLPTSNHTLKNLL